MEVPFPLLDARAVERGEVDVLARAATLPLPLDSFFPSDLPFPFAEPLLASFREPRLAVVRLRDLRNRARTNWSFRIECHPVTPWRLAIWAKSCRVRSCKVAAVIKRLYLLKVGIVARFDRGGVLDNADASYCYERQLLLGRQLSVYSKRAQKANIGLP